MSELPDGYREEIPDDVLTELAERLAERPDTSGHPEGTGPWRSHLVGVCIGWDDYYTLCENCLHRDGPFLDPFEAEQAVLQHEWRTRQPEQGDTFRGFDGCV